jgi:DNA-binding beta-propeller fold protein YncE
VGYVDDPQDAVKWSFLSLDFPPLDATWQTEATTLAGSGQIKEPGGIFIDRHNALFIADQYNYRIVKLEYGSTNLTVVIDGLNYPTDLAIDSNDTMFIAEKESLTRWPKGARNGTILGRASWLLSVALDPKQEHLYVSEYAKTYIKKYDAKGGAEQNGTVVIPNVNSRKFFSRCVCLTTVFLSLSIQPGALQ